MGDNLLVASCSLEVLRTLFSTKPLTRISLEQRGDFTIDPDGGSVHWPETDVELDLEGFRRLLDPARRERAKHEQWAHNTRFGRAVTTLRQAAGLRQADIAGLSDRQVRRIEAGEGFSAAAITRLAGASRLSENEYMQKIADLMAREDASVEKRPQRVRKARS